MARRHWLETAAAVNELSRDRLLALVTRWVDEAVTDEAPPPGLAPEFLEDDCVPPPSDSYAVWSALTALTQEVRLQSRGFKQLSDAVMPVESLPERVDTALEAHAQALQFLETMSREQIQERERNAQRRGRAAIIEVLLDVADRLQRGLASAQLAVPPKPSWWARLLGGRSSDEAHRQALEEGYRLSLERLHGALEELDLRVIHCHGGMFDAHTMQAVAVEETDRVPHGTVLDVIREGYSWQGEIFRPAQVRVARPPQINGKENNQ